MPKIVIFTGHTSSKIGSLEDFATKMAAAVNSDEKSTMLLVENDYDRVPESVRSHFKNSDTRVYGKSIRTSFFGGLKDVTGVIRHYRPAVNVVERPTRLGGTGLSLVGHHEILLPLLAAGLVEATCGSGGGRSSRRKR